MAELQIDFRSYDDWIKWSTANRKHFNALREECIEEIKKNGIDEPLTRTHRDPSELLIDDNNPRESISCNGLNSRKRAGLFALELSFDLLTEEQRKKPRILSAEALTTAARIISYKFPFFVGTEYLPTLDDRQRLFPIRHLDLANMEFESSSFDVFYSTEALTHQPDIGKCLREIFRVLKPGGIMVSAFQFLHNQSLNQVRTKLGEDGKIHHLLPPQYHANPIDPENGSLVYTIPSWEIVEDAKTIGFEDVKFTYLISARYGIVNAPQPGIFVFCATKPHEAIPGYLKTNYNRKCSVSIAPPKKFVGLIGLPRSGTTLLTSIFSAHPDINCVYEPWNARKGHRIDNVNIANFYDVFPHDYEANKSVLLVKETSTKPAYVQRMKRLFDSADSSCSKKFIVLLRDPFHIYLSEIEARVKWWGVSEALISTATFDAWAVRSLRSVFRMLSLAEHCNGLLISYEYITANPRDAVGQLMEYVEIPLDEKQFDYHLHMNKSKVRGDPKMIDSPSGVSTDRQIARDAQFNKIEQQISSSKYYRDVCLLRGYVERLTEAGPVTFNEFGHQIGIAPARHMPIN